MNKKTLSIVLIFIIIFSQFNSVFAIETNDYDNSWARKDIAEFLEKGFIKKYQDGDFRPNQNITRVEFVQAINKAFDIPKTDIKINFSDVNSLHSYYDDIRRAKAYGFIDGYPDGTFRPEGFITREEATKIIGVMLGIDGHYRDVLYLLKDNKDIGEWAKKYVNFLVAKEIISGYPDGSFKGKNNITRAEAVTFLKRIYKDSTQYTGIQFIATNEKLPVENAKVKVYSKLNKLIKESITDIRGNTDIKDMEAGEYILIAEDKNGKVFTQNIRVRDKFVTYKESELKKSVNLEGVLVDQYGNKSSKGMTLIFEGNGKFITQTLEKGLINVNLFPNSKYKIYLQQDTLELLGEIVVEDNNKNVGTLKYKSKTTNTSYIGIPKQPIDDGSTVPIINDTKAPTITLNTKAIEHIEGGKTLYIADEKLASLSGAIADESNIIKLEYSLDFGNLNLIKKDLSPSKTFTIDNLPMIVGNNVLTIIATDSSKNVGTYTIEILNFSDENSKSLVLDEEDNDNDGLLNYQEIYYGTDPNNPDTDGDGLTDYEEIVITITDPLKKDTDNNGILDSDEDFDNDGLTNIEELRLNGNPYNDDTDFDGLEDGEEVRIGTRLDKWDTDEDGLSDADEIELGIDPLFPRTDGVVLDSERTFEQTLNENNISKMLLSPENIAKPQLDFIGTGNLNNGTSITITEPDELTENRAVIGSTIRINSDSDLSNGASLSFSISGDYYANMVNTTVICQLTDDLEIEPLETHYNEELKTLSTQIREDGTYFLMDIEIFLLNLGIDIESYMNNDLVEEFVLSQMAYEFYNFNELSEDIKAQKSNYRVSEEIKVDELEFEQLELGELIFQELDVKELELEEFYDLQEEPEILQDLDYDIMFEVSNETMGQADIVFIIDATGSMGDEISNVARNINIFAESLISDYNINANFAVVEYQDITYDGLDSTIIHKNGTSYWYNGLAINRFKDKINSITANDGGDYEETPIDALEMARLMMPISSRQKFFVLLTDADYKVDNRYGVSSMAEMIDRLKRDDIRVTVITDRYEEQNYRSLYTETGGLYGDINGNFAQVLDNIAKMIGGEVGKENWIMLNGIYKPIKLLEKLVVGSNVDTDGDSIPDVRELKSIIPVEKKLQPFIEKALKKYGMSWDDYVRRGGETSIKVYDYYSDPSMKDTDGDGIQDDIDPQKLAYNITNRTLALAAELSYTNLESKVGSLVGDYGEPELGKFSIVYANNSGSDSFIGDIIEGFMDNGLGSVAIKISRPGRKDAIILAFRGSEFDDDLGNDGITDLMSAALTYNPQASWVFNSANKEYRKLIQKYPKADFFLAGHSLGGRIVQDVLFSVLDDNTGWFTKYVKKPIHCATFNAFGFNKIDFNVTKLFKKDIFLEVEDLLDNYHYRYDFVGEGLGYSALFKRLGTDIGSWTAKDKKGNVIDAPKIPLLNLIFSKVHDIDLWINDIKLKTEQIKFVY